jgi:hypothetical protein
MAIIGTEACSAWGDQMYSYLVKDFVQCAAEGRKVPITGKTVCRQPLSHWLHTNKPKLTAVNSFLFSNNFACSCRHFILLQQPRYYGCNYNTTIDNTVIVVGPLTKYARISVNDIKFFDDVNTNRCKKIATQFEWLLYHIELANRIPSGISFRPV